MGTIRCLVASNIFLEIFIFFMTGNSSRLSLSLNNQLFLILRTLLCSRSHLQAWSLTPLSIVIYFFHLPFAAYELALTLLCTFSNTNRKV